MEIKITIIEGNKNVVKEFSSYAEAFKFFEDKLPKEEEKKDELANAQDADSEPQEIEQPVATSGDISSSSGHPNNDDVVDTGVDEAQEVSTTLEDKDEVLSGDDNAQDADSEQSSPSDQVAEEATEDENK